MSTAFFDWQLSPLCVFKSQNIEPDQWQEAALTHPAQRLAVLAPRQSGKSTVTASLAIHAGLNPFSRDSMVLIVAPSQRQSNLLLSKIRSVVRKGGSGVTLIHDREDRVTLNNNVEIRALPDNPDTICGHTCHYLVLEEAARISEAAWATSMATLSATNGKAVAISTGTALGTSFQRACVNPQWQTLRVDWQTCPRLNAKFVAEMRETMPAGVFAAEFQAGFYPEDDHAVFAGLGIDTVDNLLPVTVGGLDWGFRDPTAVLWASKQKDQLVLLGEYYASQATVADVAARIPRGPVYYSDPANPRENTDLTRMGFSVRKATNRIEAGFRQIHWLLSEKRLACLPDTCPNLKRELAGLQWRQQGAQSTVAGASKTQLTEGPDHALAALRYLVLGAFPSSVERAPLTVALHKRPEVWTTL